MAASRLASCGLDSMQQGVGKPGRPTLRLTSRAGIAVTRAAASANARADAVNERMTRTGSACQAAAMPEAAPGRARAACLAGKALEPAGRQLDRVPLRMKVLRCTIIPDDWKGAGNRAALAGASRPLAGRPGREGSHCHRTADSLDMVSAPQDCEGGYDSVHFA